MYKVRFSVTLGGVGASFPETSPFVAGSDTEAVRMTDSMSVPFGCLSADLYRKDEDRWNFVQSVYYFNKR